MKKISFMDRLRYYFDILMSKGTIAQIAGLAIFTVIAVILFSLIVWGTGITAEENFLELFWSYLSITLETDPLTGEPWLLRLSTFIVTMVAIFITSILIGLLAAGVEEKINDLRKGRSKVIETNHTVILGWTPAVFPIISELVIANKNLRKSAIVILGEKDKVEMEDEIRDKVGDTERTRIVCRTGNPMDMTDLDIVNLNTSRSIIVLGADQEDPDSGVIKSLLAIIHNPNRREKPYHIVAEIKDRKNLSAAKIVGKDEVELILPSDLIARITAQTSRQAGLSVAYIELLNFSGDEIYYQYEPKLVGKTFGEALLAYEDSAVIGLHPAGGKPKLNPPMNTNIKDGDQIIAVSEDDNTIILSRLDKYGIDPKAIAGPKKEKSKPENLLILGWNKRGPIIINELENYFTPGSKLKVAADSPYAEAQIKKHCKDLKNIKIEFTIGDTTNRQVLDDLSIKDYNSVILLSYAELLDHQKADARTLVSLLHLRDIKEKTGHAFSIVSEILDIRNRSLAEVAQADDFVVSDRLISLILAQISENKRLGAVFEDFLDADGSEIYLKPISSYIKLDKPQNFYTVVEAAKKQDQVAFGYRISKLSHDSEKSYGVVINPQKSKMVKFEEEDRVIVFSES